jgi:hypothetical protein
MRFILKLEKISNSFFPGVFFELMTTDVKKSSPNSVEDLLRMNFTIKVGIYYESQLENSKYLRSEM